MIATRQQEAARKQLDALLARSQPEMPVPTHNLFNEQRLKLTTSIDDFLRHAAEAPVSTDVDDSTMAAVPSEDAKPEPPLFAHYAATVFLKRLPLTTLLYAAGSQVLEQPLRRELARAAWVRAVLLRDWKAADALQPALRELDLPLWNSMAAFRAAEASTSLSSGDDERQFTAVFVLLNNPGMKPAVREGMLRAQTLGAIDSFRDNWWCADLWPGSTWFHCCLTDPVKEEEVDFPFPAGLTEAQKKEALAEWKKLSAIGPAPNYLTQQILDYAQRHPQDQRVAEALYLAVRATHYGCSNDETSKLSKAAFQYVHERYPESEWAGKTKYYY